MSLREGGVPASADQNRLSTCEGPIGNCPTDRAAKTTAISKIAIRGSTDALDQGPRGSAFCRFADAALKGLLRADTGKGIRRAPSGPPRDQVFCTTMLGNFSDMSLARSAMRTATLRAMAR